MMMAPMSTVRLSILLCFWTYTFCKETTCVLYLRQLLGDDDGSASEVERSSGKVLIEEQDEVLLDVANVLLERWSRTAFPALPVSFSMVAQCFAQRTLLVLCPRPRKRDPSADPCRRKSPLSNKFPALTRGDVDGHTIAEALKVKQLFCHRNCRWLAVASLRLQGVRKFYYGSCGGMSVVIIDNHKIYS